MVLKSFWVDMSRISVIIPAYQASQTLESTIKSIVAQSYPPFEVIVVLDARMKSLLGCLELQTFQNM